MFRHRGDDWGRRWLACCLKEALFLPDALDVAAERCLDADLIEVIVM